ncbi:Lrp/AsnC family transcriptional regulator [Amphibacillus cookii]|uniref:Lrp/AsnC family transcriptional regulator n=1 Tax=Amphibacillus cookii TaxID=767787 RepID=UPI00195DD187|nr:Lrp/AsnC family transcriptional regulator [Amphibacillus cookii]MBM7541027.1 Lrp/AsnC family leucine-responsive transcriptional regulator [Amphibacillus cookii]
MDSFDYKIIKVLMTNGRVTWSELASQIGLSAPAIADRVNRLVKSDVIRGISARVNSSAAGIETTAFVTVSLERPAFRAPFLQLISNLDEVQECHHIAGEDDYLLKIRCRNTRDLDRVISYEIKSVEGVTKTKTTIVMDTAKETSLIPLQKDKFDYLEVED